MDIYRHPTFDVPQRYQSLGLVVACAGILLLLLGNRIQKLVPGLK